MTLPNNQNNTQNIQQNSDLNTPTQTVGGVSVLRDKLQQDIVAIITKKLEVGEMTEERAKAIAKMTLEKLPENITYEEFMRVVPTLDDEFEELKAAVFPIVTDYQKKIAEKVKQKISSLMQQKRYREVLDLTKKALEFEKKLGGE